MIYKKLLDYSPSPSLLGFGCMRFPTKNGEVDYDKTEKMLDAAIKSGVTYFDTAYVYHDGKSESIIGDILSRYDRSTFCFATKMPVWVLDTPNDTQRVFNEQLDNLKTDYIDFYLVHALDAETWKKAKDFGVVEFLKNMKKCGKIKKLGFSFHDSYDVFDEIIHAEKWDFCQLQLNYMDFNIQAGVRGEKLAQSMGIPVVVMEPVKGGLLANVPPQAEKLLRGILPDKSTASWAMRWAAGLDGVMTVLSGMSTMEQVLDNINILSDFKPLNAGESDAIDKTVKILKDGINNGCTGCRYCMPCPAGVDIPRCFSVWNEYGMYKNEQRALYHWSQIDSAARPDNCIKCGKCEEKCPQKLSIRKDLAALGDEFKKPETVEQ